MSSGVSGMKGQAHGSAHQNLERSGPAIRRPVANQNRAAFEAQVTDIVVQHGPDRAFPGIIWALLWAYRPDFGGMTGYFGLLCEGDGRGPCPKRTGLSLIVAQSSSNSIQLSGQLSGQLSAKFYREMPGCY